MARTGRFGRLPRTAPNLASLIVQIAREMAAQEDSNILNAWNEGGDYKGKPVTDQRLLKHFRERRDGLSKQDPLWDKWDQALTNYTFAIEESKMTLKYAQHKVGEGQMASFYVKWAGKLPHDSEAYRELMRSAAQFKDAANQRSAAASAGSNQAAYNAAIRGVQDRYEKSWETAQYAMLKAAYREGILQETDTVSESDDLLDLRGGDEIDSARFIDLFDMVQTDPRFGDIKEYLDKAGLQDLTYGEFQNLTKDAIHGVDLRIKTARQFGDDAGAAKFTDEKAEKVLYFAKVGDLDERGAYERMRPTDVSMLESGDLDPYEVRDLLNRRVRDLERLRDSSVAEEDKGFFQNEINALTGKGTIGATMYEGTEGGIKTAESADSAYWGSARQGSDMAVSSIESGGVLVRSYDPALRRETYSVAPRTDQMFQDAHNGQFAFLGSGKDRVLPQFVQYRQVYAQVNQTDPRTGLPLDPLPMGGDTAVGVVATVNGHDYFGVYVGEGGRDVVWSSDQNSVFAKGTNFDTDPQTGALIVSINDTLAGQPTGYNSNGQAAYDALSVVSDTFLNPDAKVTWRDQTFMQSLYDRDGDERSALLRTSDDQIRDWALSQPNPEAAYEELQGLRNNIVQDHNARAAETFDSGLVWRAARAASLESQRTGRPFDLKLSPEIEEAITRYDETGAMHARAVAMVSTPTMDLALREAMGGAPVTPRTGAERPPAGIGRYAGYSRPQQAAAAGAATPLGQFAATNMGGVQTPTGVGEAPITPALRVPASPQAFIPQAAASARALTTPNLGGITPRPHSPELDRRLLERADELSTPRLRTPGLNLPAMSYANTAKVRALPTW